MHWQAHHAARRAARRVAAPSAIGPAARTHATDRPLSPQRMCAEHPTLWDQNLFKDVLKLGGLKFRPSAVYAKKRLFLGYNGTIGIGILPVSTFCSGHTYFVQRMPQRRRFEPFSVHTTFQYSGAVGKTHRLREAMLWEDVRQRMR